MNINCNGTLVSLKVPKVMGIVNATPDSFFEGSRVTQADLLHRVEEMLVQGADFVDVGGYSTRPQSGEVSESEELRRIVPTVKLLMRHFPDLRLSVDTFRSEVARQALHEGASMVNDISSGNFDEKMWQVVADFQVPYIAMHLQGTPETMHQHTDYQDIVQEMLYYFSRQKAKAQQYGINDFIIDPGFGFSKTLEQNYEVLQKLDFFRRLSVPILVGVSRKSMLYKLLNTTADEALNATSIVNTVALMKGANILRVHDVKQARECVKIIEKIVVL